LTNHYKLKTTRERFKEGGREGHYIFYSQMHFLYRLLEFKVIPIKKSLNAKSFWKGEERYSRQDGESLQ